ncbi:PilZ domain-containing protein [Aliikangiella maris]|uniref:PilZ domain-containing protein n=2 Tax=Aliikangiella maris TaxID=3162458 RepID=A0ABV2BT17_9GAMM
MNEERRLHQRYRKRECITVDLLDDEKFNVPIVLDCHSQDISPTGLKVYADYALPLNKDIELVINIHVTRQEYVLVGRGRWLETWQDKNERQKYLVGIELSDNPESDIRKWQNYFDLLFWSN